MSFYPAYLTYLNNAHQLLKTKGWSSKALDWLLDDLSFEDKPLDIGDLWLILEDLHLIDNLLDKGGLTNAIKETKARLVGDLTYHLLEESN